MLIAKAYWDGAPFRFKHMPERVTVTPLVLKAQDFREVDALLWTPHERGRVAVVAMHPRVDFTRHYCFPALLELGITCLGANPRSPNNDIDTVHEELVLDLAACVHELRRRDFETVILLGNSGGGSLAALYQSQATRPPAERIARAPSGLPTRLAAAELLPADAVIYVAAHPGQGRVLGECLDPSVDDPGLDMYAEENGFCEPPAWCSYDEAFVARFRAGQEQRVARIDARARELLAAQREAHRQTKDPSFAQLSWSGQRDVLLHKHTDRLLTIYRTMANLHYVDNHLDASARAYGSLISDRPDLMNVKLLGFARVCTPRAWLSTWSAQSSNADMLKTLPDIATPTLFVSAGADREIYPQTHTAKMVAAIAASDRTVIDLPEAEHYFQGHRAELDEILTTWIEERFSIR